MKQNPLQHHVLNLIDTATQKNKGLSNTKDSEALHDFRVSIRRLRSFLKSYEAALGKKSKQHRQQLGELMRLTNAGRNQEVHLKWLTQQQKVSVETKNGIALVQKSLAAHPTLEHKKVQKQFTKHMSKLNQFAKKVRFKGNLNVLTASILSDYAKTLKSELSQLAKDPSLLHQTRITGKRLRYTLELLDTKGSNALISKLKDLQDTLGDINDLSLLLKHLDRLLVAKAIHWPQRFIAASNDATKDEKRLPELEQAFALAALKKHILITKQSLDDKLKKDWFGKSKVAFFKDLNAFSKTLAKTPDPSLSDK